jgi:hypothetical protein
MLRHILAAPIAIALSLGAFAYSSHRPAVVEAASGSLTTTYASNARCDSAPNPSAGQMFDITASRNLSITQFDTNLEGSGIHTVSVYYKLGSYVGFENNAGAWTLMGTDTVTAQGLGNPTPVNVSGTVPAGQIIGLYLYVDAEVVLITIGASTYSNSDLTIENGTALCNGLFGSAYTPDYTWNGTIYYEDTPASEPAVPAFNPNDGRLNRGPGDEGQPVAIYQGSVKVYGIDPATSQGALEIHLTDEQIEAAGIPSESEWSRLLKRGENHATGMPIEVYRLATGEFQVNTYFPTGKPYIFRWHPDDPYNGVYIEW